MVGPVAGVGVDGDRVIDFRKLIFGEVDVEGRTDHLRNFSSGGHSRILVKTGTKSARQGGGAAYDAGHGIVRILHNVASGLSAVGGGDYREGAKIAKKSLQYILNRQVAKTRRNSN